MNYFYDVTNGFNFFISEIYQVSGQGEEPAVDASLPSAGSYVIYIDGDGNRKLYKRIATGSTESPSESDNFQLIVDLSSLEGIVSQVSPGDILYINDSSSGGGISGLKLTRDGQESIIIKDELITSSNNMIGFPIAGKSLFDSDNDQLGEIFNDYENNQAEGRFSHAEGSSAVAEGGGSHAEGIATRAEGPGSHVEGFNTTASELCAHAEGSSTAAEKICSHAEGISTQAKENYSHAEGDSTKAKGVATHSEGYDTIAEGNNSHAEGQRTWAYGENSHAEGNKTLAYGENSHAEGLRTIAYGTHSHAEGFIDNAAADPDVTIEAIKNKNADEIIAYWQNLNTTQRFTLAYGHGSHAEGEQTLALTTKTHAEGHQTIAYGDVSHAEGGATKANGNYSHAEGNSTCAEGNYSHAGGYLSIAQKDVSFVHGQGLLANLENQACFGKFNEARNDALFIVGNGSDDTHRSNAFWVGTDGYIYTNGNIHIGNNTVADYIIEQGQVTGAKSTNVSNMVLRYKKWASGNIDADLIINLKDITVSSGNWGAYSTSFNSFSSIISDSNNIFFTSNVNYGFASPYLTNIALSENNTLSFRLHTDSNLSGASGIIATFHITKWSS